MLFSSVIFLFYFLPIVLILYFLVPTKLKNTILLAASLLFYAYGEPRYIFLMLATIIIGYVSGLLMERAHKKRRGTKLWLVLSCIAFLGSLAFFKYADFFIGNYNSIASIIPGLNTIIPTDLPFLKLALPIGISFYTFQILSYTVDVYRGNTPAQHNFIHFATYVALFPQLIAGPIVRYTDVAKELADRHSGIEDVYYGFRRFIIGLAKKILIANMLAAFIIEFRSSDEPSVLFYWLYAIAFTLQIYFDFSGYSDMAIGLGRIFGFHFIENFNYPYISKSISEFWRRWHMSLGSWFRDYVYIPLGGNRVSLWKHLRNILIVWFLTGFWHGASWNFICWGLLYGILLLIEKPVTKWLKGKHPIKGNVFTNALSHIYVMLFVICGFVLFNAADLSQALSDLGYMFGLKQGIAFCSEQTLYYLRSYGVVLIIAIIGATPLVRNTAQKLSVRFPKVITAVVTPVILIVLMVVMTGFLVDGSFNPFLYFRF